MIGSPKQLYRPHTSQNRKGGRSPNNLGDDTESAKSDKADKVFKLTKYKQQVEHAK